MPKLINRETNQLVEVPHEAAARAFLSGKFNLPSTEAVVMANEKGELFNVEPKDVHSALMDSNYTFAAPEAIKEADLQAKYGEGFGNEAASFGLGAANILSFGAANPILQGSGVDPEALREIPARNPASNVAGQVVGALAPIPGAAPSLIAKAGMGASEALLRAIPAATSLPGRIAAKSLAQGVGGAVEGALFGAGQQLSESTLGDPNFTAQRVAAHIGFSGLLGGGLGAALGAAQVAVPAVFSKARESLESVYSGVKASEAAESGFVKAASFVSGKSPEDIVTALKNRGFDGSPSVVRKFSEDLTGALQKQYDEMGQASRTAFKSARPDESALLVESVDAAPIYDKLSNIDSILQDAIGNMRSKPELYPARYVSKLEDISAAFTRDVIEGNSSAAGFKALDDLKGNLSTQIKFGRIPSEESMDAVSLIKTLRHTVKEALEDAATFGDAGARQGAFNNAFNEFKTAQDLFQKKFTLKKNTKSGAVTHYVDPVKVNTYLNQIDDIRGAGRTEILNDYLAASRRYLDQIDSTYKNLPDANFDSKPLQDLLERTYGVKTDFEGHAAVKRAFERLRRGSGPIGDAGSIMAVQAAKMAGVPYTVAAPIAGIYEILRNPGTAIQRLAKLESAVSKISKSIEKGADRIVNPSSSAKAVATGVGADLNKEFKENIKNLNNLTDNAEAISPKLEEISAHFSEHAPQVAVGLQQTAVRGIQFLQSKAPAAPKTFPLQEEWTPSASDIAQFNKYYKVVEDPMSVYKQIQTKTLTKESIEALQAVYPDLYQAMQRAVIDSMSTHNKKMPYSTKVQLSLFLNQDLTPSTDSRAILSNQAALAGPPPQLRAVQGSKSKMNLSERSLTSMQKTANRR